MFVEDRVACIKKAKLNHIVVRYIFAKSLYAVLMDTDFSNYMEQNLGENKNMNAEDVLLCAIASVVMNRFVFESNVVGKYVDMVQILTDEALFDCWKNLKRMDAIDTKDMKFRKCLGVAQNALIGNLDDMAGGAKSFKKLDGKNSYEKFLRPLFSFCGYGFY